MDVLAKDGVWSYGLGFKRVKVHSSVSGISSEKEEY